MVEQLAHGNEGGDEEVAAGGGAAKAERVKKVQEDGIEGLTSEDIAGWSKVEALRAHQALEESKETLELIGVDLEKWKKVNERVK